MFSHFCYSAPVSSARLRCRPFVFAHWGRSRLLFSNSKLKFRRICRFSKCLLRLPFFLQACGSCLSPEFYDLFEEATDSKNSDDALKVLQDVQKTLTDGDRDSETIPANCVHVRSSRAWVGECLSCVASAIDILFIQGQKFLSALWIAFCLDAIRVPSGSDGAMFVEKNLQTSLMLLQSCSVFVPRTSRIIRYPASLVTSFEEAQP